MKAHLHTEQFDNALHAWCGRGPNKLVVGSDEFEALAPAARCKLCEREWFPNGQPDWHRALAVERQKDTSCSAPPTNSP